MKQKIAVFSAILLGMVIGLFATRSLIIDSSIIYNPVAIFIDIIVMGFSYITAWVGIWYILKEKIAYEEQNKYWDYKIQPLVNTLTDSIGRINAMEQEVMKNKLKLNTTFDYAAKMHGMDTSMVYILPGITFKFLTKVIILFVFIMATLTYAAKFFSPDEIPYLILIIYLLWWALFTSEYHLFNNNMAWIWAFVPIMIVPFGGIILDATIGLNGMVGILFFFMFIYAYSYYSWGVHIAVGFKLFEDNKIKDYIINNSDTYFQHKKVKNKINRRWIDTVILACIAIAGIVAIWIFV
jgi:hypothetical protein